MIEINNFYKLYIISREYILLEEANLLINKTVFSMIKTLVNLFIWIIIKLML
jgi:hypothetical protein